MIMTPEELDEQLDLMHRMEQNDIKAIDMNTGEETIAKNAGDFISIVISYKRKLLKERVNDLDKYHNGIVDKHEVFSLIDLILR